MTTATAPLTSQDLFSDGSEFELPEVIEEVSEDATEQVHPPANVCPTCGEEVVRQPGQRGRVAKYHPECRPSRSGKRESVSGGAARTVKVSKAEELAAYETEQILADVEVKLRKLTFMLAIVEPYDALVIHVNTPEFLDNLRPVLMQFGWLRKGAGAAATGGSIFGLIMTLVTTLAPIAAHHNLVPVKKLTAWLLQVPFMMMRMQERVAAGNTEAFGDELVSRVMEEGRRAKEARMRAQTESENGGQYQGTP